MYVFPLTVLYMYVFIRRLVTVDIKIIFPRTLVNCSFVDTLLSLYMYYILLLFLAGENLYLSIYPTVQGVAQEYTLA